VVAIVALSLKIVEKGPAMYGWGKPALGTTGRPDFFINLPYSTVIVLTYIIRFLCGWS
jgi:hypothetical protein